MLEIVCVFDSLDIFPHINPDSCKLSDAISSDA